ncbi:chaperone modulator CbpM [Actinoallomurus bryophytorum]|nr:chaperone modulator CbpM [Actinoallomurus bryophytorum]
MRYALMRPLRLDLDAFARASGVHPELVGRLVGLGLIEPERDVHGALWFSHAQIAEVNRIQRLRSAFALNYASVGLVCDLLDRIAALESAMRHRSRPPGDRSWT